MVQCSGIDLIEGSVYIYLNSLLFSKSSFVFCFIFQVSKNGMVNSVFTLYELSNGDDTEGEGMALFIECKDE